MGIQEIPRASLSPCLSHHLLDVASRGFTRHRKSSELRNVTTIPQLSLKMLRSSQQMSNKDKEKMLIKLTTKVLQNSRKASASPLVFLDTIRLYAP